MSTNTYSEPRISDRDIIRYNSVGLPMTTIGQLLGCTQSYISIRMRSMELRPFDTRRSFMEEIFFSLTPTQQEWLMDQLGHKGTIKEYVKNLLVQAYFAQPAQPEASPKAA